MDEIFAIRWHGRGGQGAKTASILLARIAAAAGCHVQAFPEYGPERMGAPVVAYTRISTQKIKEHCQVEYPDLVAVLDPTLLGTVDVTANIKQEGSLIINSHKEPSQIKKENDLKQTIKVFSIDADKISEEEIGRVFPNTPLMGAVNKVAELLDEEEFITEAKEEFNKKFSGKEKLVQGNLKSVQRSLEEIKS